MIAALIILLALVAVGAVLYLLDRPAAATPAQPEEEEAATAADEECCGMHITCERDSLLAAVSPQAEYYDDEELDDYRGTPADAYTDTAIEQFRDVLLTLRPDEIAGWARSIQLRGITLPSSVRDELLMIVAEERKKRN